MTDLDLSQASADAAGLTYVCDDIPGIRRHKRGRGFSYELPDRLLLTDCAERDRIASLAIPPAWTDVWICPAPDGHLLATGRDQWGRKQYRYHSKWSEVRSADRFGALPAFAEVLPSLREQVEADLRKRSLSRDRVLALVVRLLDHTLVLVGNDAYAAENESYGLTTMFPDHVEVDRQGLVFDFVAKSGLARQVPVHDQKLARIVHQVSELGGQDLFAYVSDGEVADVTSSDVNAYLRTHAGDGVTAKHFRTWGGTTSAAAALAVSRVPESEAVAGKEVLSAFDVAASELGITRTVCRQSYFAPRRARRLPFRRTGRRERRRARRRSSTGSSGPFSASSTTDRSPNRQRRSAHHGGEGGGELVGDGDRAAELLGRQTDRFLGHQDKPPEVAPSVVDGQVGPVDGEREPCPVEAVDRLHKAAPTVEEGALFAGHPAHLEADLGQPELGADLLLDGGHQGVGIGSVASHLGHVDDPAEPQVRSVRDLTAPLVPTTELPDGHADHGQ